jgi:hypothetical protein
LWVASVRQEADETGASSAAASLFEKE